MNNDILVIEDNGEMQDLLRLLLEQEGYHIISAATAGEGIAILRTRPEVILILLDLTLPDMKSDEFLSAVKTERILENTPIMFFSAVPRLKQMKLPQGVVGVIQKPFKIPDFIKTIGEFRTAPTTMRQNLFTKKSHEKRVG